MKKLNFETLKDIKASDKLEIGCGLSGSVRIMQFGEGNFLRAFVNWIFDKLSGSTDFASDTVIVQAIAQGRVKELKAADCFYTVALRGKQDGQLIDNKRIITTIADAISCYDDFAKVQDYARSTELRYIVSNTTEAGITYQSEAYTPDKPQNTFPAKITALLKTRFDALGQADSGLVFLPVELIEANGAALKKCVLQYANDWQLGQDFIDWIEAECIFCDTLVDRIVTGYPRDEIDEIQQELGYQDDNFVAGEIFHLWVIQSPVDISGELPFEKAGLNVKWTDDLPAYRTSKVRFLNGAHTSSVLAGYHCGLDSVGQMTENPLLREYLTRIMFDEIAPAVDLSADHKKAFAQAILERFENPFIFHRLLDISLNSVSKWSVRVMPTLLERTAVDGKPPRLLAFSLAALLRFYRGIFVDDKLMGSRDSDDTPYEIRDDRFILEYFANLWARDDFESVAADALANSKLWSQSLIDVPGLMELVKKDLELMLAEGMAVALAQALEEAK